MTQIAKEVSKTLEKRPSGKPKKKSRSPAHSHLVTLRTVGPSKGRVRKPPIKKNKSQDRQAIKIAKEANKVVEKRSIKPTVS